MSENGNEKDKKKISRRGLLKGAGLVAGGAALMSTLPPGATKSFAKTTDGTASAGEPSYEVYNTDVLVIGGGIGATTAALQAFGEGVNVMMVDKGPFRQSGGGGMNWAVITGWIDDVARAFRYNIYNSEGMINQKVGKTLHEEWASENLLALLAQRGTSVFRRHPNGKFWVLNAAYGNMFEDYFPRHDMDVAKGFGLKVVDRTMITEYLVQDSRCVGAMGIYLPTGTMRVFRAKAVVAAAGPYPWIYGWNTVAPQTIHSPDCTGDLDGIAYRHGCRLQDMEFWENHLISIEPSGLSCSYNGGIGADAQGAYHYVCDKDGVYWMKDIPEAEMTRGLFIREIAKRVEQGKGSPNGGVYLDLRAGEEIIKTMRVHYSRNIIPFKEKFGIDVKKQLLEVAIAWAENHGHPLVDENFESDIKGVFYPVGGGVRGARINHTCQGPIIGGKVSGRNAAKYARDAREISEIDWKQVHDEYARIHEIRTRKADKSLAPHEVRRRIQRACFKALGPIRKGAAIKQSIKELEWIRKNDFPRMALRNDVQQYNMEWKQAIENYNMMDIAEACCRATLMRTETRGSHYRSDFPKRDDKNWLCNIIVHKTDGGMKLEKKPIVTSELSPDQIKKMLKTGWKKEYAREV
jgi:succinate dehydrogenase / fumarate reductase flavoprotein subunit